MYYLGLFLVLIALMCGCYIPANPNGCPRGLTVPTVPSASTDDCIHVILFAGFRQMEVEQKIPDEVATDDSPFYNAQVLRYEITNSQHIVELAELGFIGSINWQVPEVAYGYHILVDAPPTDAVLESLDEWAKETTEGTGGSVVSVLAETEVLLMIQRMSDIPPVVMQGRDTK